MPTEHESNKGDDKGNIPSRDLTKEETKRLASRLKALSNSEAIEISETFIDWLMSDRKILKGFLIAETKRSFLLSGQWIPYFLGKKGPKSSAAKEEFLDWTIGKEEKIKRHLSLTGGKKIVFQWMKDDGLDIKQTAAYRHLKEFS